ncbi:MAG: glucose-1-phosphate adenylyltransferase [Clostridia bacterium]|nr:glucose-1-phosphate adenylyltransferase [Clostridia bacterium]MBN2883704.1 glucose-1-phosphate adenylyltransferase [Clostridia bacterium]
MKRDNGSNTLCIPGVRTATKKKETIAMLLAGGQGSRLGALTNKMAKPAVPFGGKYRIIDFALSNCTNSDIDTLGVLTQYQPLELNSYIGNGHPWDLDRITGGVYVLPPYMSAKAGEWYRGTANAIFQNIPFIEQFNPEYVVILSGDHIYKMDYSLMVDFHKKKGADATIAVQTVPYEEASRFGLMVTDENDRIINFEEKPANPTSNRASMGVYVFSWPVLKKYLIEDENNPDSSNDFGKNIIPAMLACHNTMYAYTFNGYWKDVGTIESLWEANMDLLSSTSTLNLYDSNWHIYSRNPGMPPHYASPDANISESMVTEGCHVSGEVSDSILFAGVTVHKGASIRNSVVMPNTIVGSGSKINYAIIAEDVIIGCDVVFKGSSPSLITVIGPGAIIPDGAVIEDGVRISAEEARDLFGEVI